MMKQGSCTKLLDSEPDSVYLVMKQNGGKNIDGKATDHSRKTILCAMFLLFILMALVAMLYVVNQGFAGDRYLAKWHDERSEHQRTDDAQVNPNRMRDRPSFKEKAKMARYIVHNSQWGVLTTFSTHVKGYPWGEVVSVTDGLANNSTGIPLIYISTMDIAAHDVDANPLVSFTFSEAQQSWCRDNKIDPEDPRCSRVHLFGKIVKLTPDEIPAAKKAMFAKHPVMADWPESHHFFFAKIQLSRVEVLDYFGPISHISIDEYLKAKP